MHTTTATHTIVRNRPGWTECACGQIYSGARTEERAAEHVANPDPDSLGALLSQFIHTVKEA